MRRGLGAETTRATPNREASKCAVPDIDSVAVP
jgi:hypothetical protein